MQSCGCSPKTVFPICHHAGFGRSTLIDVGINIGNPQSYGGLELWSLGIEGMTDRKIHAAPHMCYHIKVGSSATKDVCIHIKEPQNWKVLGPRPLWVGHG